MNAIVIDVETSSLFGDVIELAYGCVDSIGDDLSECKSMRFLPNERMDPRAVAVHRIARIAKSSPPSLQAPDYIPDSKYWIGHNIIYDWERLGRPSGIRLVCTQQIAKMVWPKLDSYRMSALYLQLFGVSEATVADLEGLHSAATDVKICWKILQRAAIDSGVIDIRQFPFTTHPDDWRRHGI